MKRIRWLILIAIIFWFRTAFYAVDVTEFAYVTRFGDPIKTVDGGTEAGLWTKLPWPIDSVQRIDRRLQTFDLPAVESLTRDLATNTVDKTLAVDAFVTWRIPNRNAADKFIRAVGTPEQAKRILSPRVNGKIASVISTLPLDDIIAVADAVKLEDRTAKLQSRLFGDELATTVLNEYGIELVDLRLRRFSYPEAVRASIAERIRSERARKVADYESEGRKRASDIASAAEKEARTIEAESRARRQTLEGQADVEADRIRNEAHAADPKFYEFLQKLKTYQVLLSETRDVLLLSSQHPLFDRLLTPPGLDKKP